MRTIRRRDGQAFVVATPDGPMRVTRGRLSARHTVEIDVERNGEVEHYDQRLGKALVFKFPAAEVRITPADVVRTHSLAFNVEAPKFWLVTRVEQLPVGPAYRGSKSET